VGGGLMAVALVDPKSIDLWDKVLDLTLINEDGTTEVVLTPGPDSTGPTHGRKQTVRLKGKLLPSNVIIGLELRVTNLYLSKPLSSYKKIRVEAGYRKGVTMAFEGSVQFAFQELPGPDAVVCFQFLLGDLTTWTGTFYSGSFDQGVSLSAVVNFIAASMQLTPRYNVVPDPVLPADLPFTGLTKDLLPMLENLFSKHDAEGNDVGLRLCPFGGFLLAYTMDQGLTQELAYRMDFVTHAKHNSAGWEIQAPWVPNIVPGQLVVIDPKYFRQDFGGSLVSKTNTYRVLMIEFDFCTTDSTNMMTLVALAA
jgi:hypothetical protein